MKGYSMEGYNKGLKNIKSRCNVNIDEKAENS